MRVLGQTPPPSLFRVKAKIKFLLKINFLSKFYFLFLKELIHQTLILSPNEEFNTLTNFSKMHKMQNATKHIIEHLFS